MYEQLRTLGENHGDTAGYSSVPTNWVRYCGIVQVSGWDWLPGCGWPLCSLAHSNGGNSACTGVLGEDLPETGRPALLGENEPEAGRRALVGDALVGEDEPEAGRPGLLGEDGPEAWHPALLGEDEAEAGRPALVGEDEPEAVRPASSFSREEEEAESLEETERLCFNRLPTPCEQEEGLGQA